MSKRLFAALSVITLALTGCAADDEDAASGTVDLQTESETATEQVDTGGETVEVIDGAASDTIKTGLQGAGQQNGNEEIASDEPAITADEATPTTAEESAQQPSEGEIDTGTTQATESPDEGDSNGGDDLDDKFGEKIISDRGNLVKTIGQPAGLADEYGENETIVELKVTEIEPQFECTSSFAEPPANGNYIAITFDIQTHPALADASWPEWYMSAYDMHIISPDGVRENDSIGNSYSCLSAAGSLPSTLGPNERATGKIVLDSAHESGILIVALGGAVNGWEWEF
ncbi:hypothetical protein [Flaviflexus sp.]|uniref:hypothetical protein n=1 Tax=Flaviflexus sp. TaxID=1969482 RepID=UPI003F9287AC